MKNFKNVNNLDGLLNKIDLEEFFTQEYRNNVFDKISEIIDKDPSQLDNLFDMLNSENTDTGLKRKFNSITSGITPLEFATIVTLDAPNAISFKESDQITHVFHFFGSPGIGKTQTITNALNSFNGIIFQIGSKLKQNADKEEINKGLNPYIDFLNKQFKDLGININHNEFANSLIKAAEAYSRILAKDPNLQGLQNETLDTISKNPEQNSLDNLLSYMTNIITVKDGKQIDIKRILPGKPVVTSNDTLQNTLDPTTHNTLIQKIGESTLGTGLLVYTSNHSEEAYGNLAKIYSQNEGYEARAGLFLNATEPRSNPTTVEAEALSSFTVDNNIIHLLENIDEYARTNKQTELLNLYSRNENFKKLIDEYKNEYTRISNILKAEGVANSLVDFLKSYQNELIENNNYLAKEVDKNTGKVRSVHKGQSELLRSLLDTFIPDPENSNRHILQTTKDFISSALKEILPFGEYLVNTSADISINKSKNGSLKDLKNLKELTKKSLEDKNLVDDKVQYQPEIKKFAENLRKSFQNNPENFPISESIQELASKLSGEISPENKSLTEKGIKLFQKLNLRDICGISKEGTKTLNNIESLRHIKMTDSVLNHLKQVLDEKSFKSLGLRFILGTFGANEISKEFIKRYLLNISESTKTITSEELRNKLDEFANKQNVDGNKEEAIDNISDFIVNNLYPDYTRIDSKDEIKNPEAFISSQVVDRLVKSIEKIENVKDFDNFDQSKFGEELDPIVKFIDNLKKLSPEDLEEIGIKVYEKNGENEEVINLTSSLLQDLPKIIDQIYKYGDVSNLSKAMPKQQNDTIKKVKEKVCKDEGLKNNLYKAFLNQPNKSRIKNSILALSALKMI